MPHRSASGARGRHSFCDVMERIALVECPSCRSRSVPKPVVQGVIRKPVVLEARCAEVVRTPVVLSARPRQADSRCAWFRSRHVVPGVIPDVRDGDRTPVMQGVIPGWCGRRMLLATRRKATGAPNTSFQPTAARTRLLVF